MKVNVSQILNVELSKSEARRVAENVIREAAGLPIDRFHAAFDIENEYVISIHHLNDGTPYTSRLRVAAGIDAAAVKLLKAINL
jgi:hypothetical protein